MGERYRLNDSEVFCASSVSFVFSVLSVVQGLVED